MDERLHRVLVLTAATLALVFAAVSLYDCTFKGRAPGDLPYLVGEQLFEDAEYERALAKFEEALAEAPGHFHATRARARSLMQLERHADALAAFDALVDANPDFAALHANRGILNDRMGRYREAMADYRRAISLDQEMDEGPHWMTRFLRNQSVKPPTIGERAAYLEAELAKPPSERRLRLPRSDDAQRPYKQ